MRTLVLVILLSMPGISVAQAFEIPLTVTNKKDGYSAIEFMSAGESSVLPLAADAEDLPPATPQAQRLRIVVYRSEIYQSLAIETLTTGLEGCCSKVAQTQSVDLQAFASQFGFTGEVSGFVFSGWSSPDSFRFTYQGKPFHAIVSKSNYIRVDRGYGH